LIFFSTNPNRLFSLSSLSLLSLSLFFFLSFSLSLFLSQSSQTSLRDSIRSSIQSFNLHLTHQSFNHSIINHQSSIINQTKRDSYVSLCLKYSLPTDNLSSVAVSTPVVGLTVSSMAAVARFSSLVSCGSRWIVYGAPVSLSRGLSTAAVSSGSGRLTTKYRPVVVSGPSGVGKSTLINQLTDKYPNSFAFTVSHTTRAPRPGEQNGQQYHFVSRSEFERMASEAQFVEFAEFAGNLYGTSKRSLLDVEQHGRIPLLDIEIQGVRQIRRVPDIFPACIFIRPPSLEALEQRLRSRGDTSLEAIQQRLQRAQRELQEIEEPGLYDVILVSGPREIIGEAFERAVLEFNRHFTYS
jgi:guanylate kinase